MTPKLVVFALAMQEGENWFDENVKVPYPFSARNVFSLLLILLDTGISSPWHWSSQCVG